MYEVVCTRRERVHCIHVCACAFTYGFRRERVREGVLRNALICVCLVPARV